MQEKIYSGYIIAYEQCDPIDSPNEWGNNDMFLVYDHRDFCVKREGFNPDLIWEYIQTNNVEEILKQSPDYVKDDRFDKHYIYPVYAYIHSGVALSLGNIEYPFNCKWDTSMKGFILVRKDTAEESFKANQNPAILSQEGLARSWAESLISTWNTYLSGDIWRMEVRTLDGKTIDSCNGYYGKEDMLQDARDVIDYQVELDNKLKLLESKKHYYNKRIKYYKYYFWVGVVMTILNLYESFNQYIYYDNIKYLWFLSFTFLWCLFCLYNHSKQEKYKKVVEALSLS